MKKFYRSFFWLKFKVSLQDIHTLFLLKIDSNTSFNEYNCVRHYTESSIVNEVIKTISSLFISLYEKILRAQKHVISKNQLTKQK